MRSFKHSDLLLLISQKEFDLWLFDLAVSHIQTLSDTLQQTTFQLLFNNSTLTYGDFSHI